MNRLIVIDCLFLLAWALLFVLARLVTVKSTLTNEAAIAKNHLLTGTCIIATTGLVVVAYLFTISDWLWLLFNSEHNTVNATSVFLKQEGRLLLITLTAAMGVVGVLAIQSSLKVALEKLKVTYYYLICVLLFSIGGVMIVGMMLISLLYIDAVKLFGIY